MKYANLIAVLAMAGLSACASAKTPALSSGERYRADGLVSEEYRLGGGDKVHLTFFNEPQLSGDFVVDSEGKLSLPLIGGLPVMGKTTLEVARMVEHDFKVRNYILDPKVSLEVSTYRPYFILGEVRQPGQYPYNSGLTAWNAIATAQGLTPRAKKTLVYIRRFGEAAEVPYVLSPDLRVWPGDTIRVEERLF